VWRCCPEEGATRYVVRLAKNSTFRRASPPPSQGRSRPPRRGALVRPLPRTDKGQSIPATPPDRVETWTEADVVLRAAFWDDLALPDAVADSPTLTVVALDAPRRARPLAVGLLAPALRSGAPRLLR